jgi:hypothetical protein
MAEKGLRMVQCPHCNRRLKFTVTAAHYGTTVTVNCPLCKKEAGKVPIPRPPQEQKPKPEPVRPKPAHDFFGDLFKPGGDFGDLFRK